MKMECPGCGSKLAMTFKESLEPYSMTFSIRPDAGRSVQAKTAGGVLSNLQDLLEVIGDSVGHTTLVHLIGARVDDDMSVHFTVSATPVLKEQPVTKP